MGLKHISPNESGFDNDKLVTETIEAHTDHKHHTVPHDLSVDIVEDKIKAHEK